MASPRHMLQRKPKLSAERKAEIDAHVFAFIDAQIHPVKLQTIAYHLGTLKLDLVWTYDRAAQSVQRLKEAGRVVLRTGPGAGWHSKRSGR